VANFGGRTFGGTIFSRNDRRYADKGKHGTLEDF
jgi:hypothetical protein